MRLARAGLLATLPMLAPAAGAAAGAPTGPPAAPPAEGGEGEAPPEASSTTTTTTVPAAPDAATALPFAVPGAEGFRISLLELQSGNPEKNLPVQAGDQR